MNKTKDVSKKNKENLISLKLLLYLIIFYLFNHYINNYCSPSKNALTLSTCPKGIPSGVNILKYPS